MLPSRLELKRPEGSANEAPLAKVSFTTALYVSPVQMMPACSHTGTPRHFHSSTTSGQTSLMTPRTRASVSPRQSPSSLIRASISREGEAPSFAFVAALLLFVMTGVAFFTGVAARALRNERMCRHINASATGLGKALLVRFDVVLLRRCIARRSSAIGRAG